MINDANVMVRRRAIEAVTAQDLTPARATPALANALYARSSDPDRFVRFVARVALERTPREAWRSRVLAETNPVAAFRGCLR